MAVSREQPKCPKCNGYISAITKKYPAGVVFVGDNFISWDWEGHKCQDKNDSKIKFPTEKQLNDFLKSEDYKEIIGKKIFLWNKVPLPIFKIKEFTGWNGSHFRCDTDKGAVVIHDIILYQLCKFGIAIDAYGCQSEIIKD
ncbi:MAG TPA: hypothetical protein VN026_18010 [Bacteroidia bacterium]|jgi:hypothetical protein|nr:hypothetical protein [Bacteroidia bacterium]